MSVGRSAFDDDFAEYVAGDMRRLLRLAFLLTGDREDAHDLTQETLIRVGSAWRHVDPKRDPTAYASKTMARLSWRAGRRHLRWGTFSDGRAPDLPVSSDEQRRVEDKDELRAALSSLGSRQRTVLILRYYCDYSEQQTAEILNCSVGTVKSQAARGLQRVREHIEMAMWQDSNRR